MRARDENKGLHGIYIYVSNSVAHNACCVCARPDAKSEMRNIGTEPITAELRKREARSVLKLSDVWRERRAVQIERDIKERMR